MGNKLSHHFFHVFSVESGKSSPFNKNRYVCFGFVNDLLLPLTFITDTWVRTANMRSLQCRSELVERVRKLVRKLVRGQFVEVGSHLLQGILITNDDGDDDDDDDNNNNNNRNN